MQDKVIVGSRLRAALLVFGACALVVVGVWLVGRHDATPKQLLGGWLAILFFGFCAAMGLLQIARPVRVSLFNDRFEITTGLGRTARVPWADIQPLFIWSMRSTRLVAYNYLDGRKPANRGALSEMSSSLGADGALPNTLPLGADALLSLMNARREAALAKPRA